MNWIKRLFCSHEMKQYLLYEEKMQCVECGKKLKRKK